MFMGNLNVPGNLSCFLRKEKKIDLFDNYIFYDGAN